MRNNFRLKMDFSQIFQDARQLSWVYIDSTKIIYVHHLIAHIRKIFEIQTPFHLMSKFEGNYLFLPLEEDIRVLENNDTVIIVPGTGIENGSEMKDESLSGMQNGFVKPIKAIEKESSMSSEKSYRSLKFSANNTVENIKDTLSLSNNLYTTAVHEISIIDNGSSKTTDDNFTEDNSIIKDDIVLSKRKRIRKRRQKISVDKILDSDASHIEYSGKKPKIIDSVLISTGKHIRFKGLEIEDTVSDSNITNENNNQRKQTNNVIINKPYINKELNTLLNLGQSSTPLSFEYKKGKKESEINENCRHVIETETVKKNVQSNDSFLYDDVISFKVFRMGEDYTPQLSQLITAKVLSYDAKESKYTLKVLYGKDQLQEPEGKFSLPKDDESEEDKSDDIFILDKCKLIESRRVSANGSFL